MKLAAPPTSKAATVEGDGNPQGVKNIEVNLRLLPPRSRFVSGRVRRPPLLSLSSSP